MKIKAPLIILGFTLVLSGCVGIVERPAAVYVEPRPVVIVHEEPPTEIVIIQGRPVRRVIVAPRPVIIHRHRHH